MSDEKQLISASDLAEMLEPLIRRVVREELARAFEEQGVTYLSSDSPLYDDLLEILDEKARGELKFDSYEDVLGERSPHH